MVGSCCLVGWFVGLFAWLVHVVCLLARLLAYLFACLTLFDFVCLFAFLNLCVCLLVCLFDGWLGCFGYFYLLLLFVCLLVCLFVGFVGLLVCLVGRRFPGWSVG